MRNCFSWFTLGDAQSYIYYSDSTLQKKWKRLSPEEQRKQAQFAGLEANSLLGFTPEQGQRALAFLKWTAATIFYHNLTSTKPMTMQQQEKLFTEGNFVIPKNHPLRVYISAPDIFYTWPFWSVCGGEVRSPLPYRRPGQGYKPIG